jgi:diguanylate cyclase (GGDEF)-like protein
MEVLLNKPPDAPAGASSTISVGLAAWTPAMTDISALMRAADKALYEAKRGGRNRVVCAEEAPAAIRAAS